MICTRRTGPSLAQFRRKDPTDGSNGWVQRAFSSYLWSTLVARENAAAVTRPAAAAEAEAVLAELTLGRADCGWLLLGGAEQISHALGEGLGYCHSGVSDRAGGKARGHVYTESIHKLKHKRVGCYEEGRK
jgi:hypothetical protein